MSSRSTQIATKGWPARPLLPSFLSLWLAFTGCAKLELGEGFTLWESDPKPQTPDSVAAVWTEASLHHPGQPVVRGFGGRVLFHGGDDQQAVPVEGKVIVYAYDNDRPNRDDPAPDKKFVFPAHTLAAHQSDSKLGPSYSFWLPWDNAGGPQRRISLLTRFEDDSGKIVLSQMAHVTLPGPIALPPNQAGLAQFPRDPQSRTALPGSGQQFPGTERASDWSSPNAVPGAAPLVQPAAFDSPVLDTRQAAAPPASKTPRSVTIDVAPDQANRLLSASRGGTSRQNPTAPGLQTNASNPPATPPGRGSVSFGRAAVVESARLDAVPPVGSAPTQFPARNAPATRLTYDPVRRQPHRVESPHRLPATPRSGWNQPETAPPGDDVPERR